MWPSTSIPLLGVEVQWYPTCTVVAVVFMLTMGASWGARLGELPRRELRIAIAFLAVVAIFGGRVWYVLGQPDPSIWKVFIWNTGRSAMGGILALAVVMPFVARRLSVSVGRLADAITPPTAVAMGITRVGCFLFGCCFGTVCRWPWCVRFPRDTYMFDLHRARGLVADGDLTTCPVHPVQLYFVLGWLGIALAAARWHPRRRYDGEVALFGCSAFGLMSLVLESFREDYFPRVYWGAWPQLQCMGALIAASAIAALVCGRRLSNVRE